jgi:hypothetical protein
LFDRGIFTVEALLVVLELFRLVRLTASVVVVVNPYDLFLLNGDGTPNEVLIIGDGVSTGKCGLLAGAEVGDGTTTYDVGEPNCLRKTTLVVGIKGLGIGGAACLLCNNFDEKDGGGNGNLPKVETEVEADEAIACSCFDV